MRVAIILLIVSLSVSSCAGFKNVVRNINDAAVVLCNLFAAEQSEKSLQGLSPKDFCAIPENIAPFLRQAQAMETSQETLGAFNGDGTDNGTE